jgi:hypothetical protein
MLGLIGGFVSACCRCESFVDIKNHFLSPKRAILPPQGNFFHSECHRVVTPGRFFLLIMLQTSNFKTDENILSPKNVQQRPVKKQETPYVNQRRNTSYRVKLCHFKYKTKWLPFCFLSKMGTNCSFRKTSKSLKHSVAVIL